jgi:hypothetical protein
MKFLHFSFFAFMDLLDPGLDPAEKIDANPSGSGFAALKKINAMIPTVSS